MSTNDFTSLKIDLKWKSLLRNNCENFRIFPEMRVIPIFDERIRYFTFLQKDVGDIYQYQQKLSNKGDRCYITVYLGQYDQRNDVPLRTIIHLDDSEGWAPLDGDDDPSFEFSTFSTPARVSPRIQ